MKKNILSIMTIVSLLFSCTEETIQEITPFVGEEVKFTATLNKAGDGSRTIYGTETDSYIEVNWVEGDQITIYGADCAEGKRQANYTVSANGTLTKNSENGVQWGTAEKSDFFAIYPAVDNDFVDNEDGTYTINTSIATTQYLDFIKTGTNWVGTPYVGSTSNHNMKDALMYANIQDQANDGSSVSIQFTPFSTVLKFKLNGYDVSGDLGEEVPQVSIQKIRLISPSDCPIAGPCNFTFPTTIGADEPKVSAEALDDATNEIEIITNDLYIAKGETLEFCVFTIPQEGYLMSEDNTWSLEITTYAHGTHTFNIAPKSEANLTAGKIHKINVSPFTVVEETNLTEKLTDWISYIPRNVYLSELSLPGAWYATNGDYQATTDLTEQYANGVRAFNIDCRITPEKITLWQPSGSLLTCAGTEDTTIGGAYWNNNAKLVLTALTEIASCISDREFVEVILTISEKPFSSSGTAYGSIQPEDVIPAITTMLNANAETLKLHTSAITANTTVNDVLGKMIVKINSNAEDISKYVYPTYSLVSFASMATGNYNSTTDNITDLDTDYYRVMQQAPLYWGNIAISEPAAMTYYYHQAQVTGSLTNATSTTSIPTLKDRADAVDNIISESAGIYASGTHNALFQLGIGGYIAKGDDADGTSRSSEDRTTVATYLNNHVLTQINAKLTSSPSPIGTVLMNYCTSEDYYGPNLVKAIVSMNNHFHLNRDPNVAVWPDGYPTTESVGEEQPEV